MSYHAVQQYRRSSSEGAMFRTDIPTSNNALLENSRRRHPQSFRVITPSQRQLPVAENNRPVTPEARPALEREKILVQAPSSLTKFFSTVILLVCRLYLHFPTTTKVPMYLLGVFVLSAAGDLLRPAKKFYLSQPDNVLTVWFVEYAHFWTFSLIGTYVALTSYFYSGGKRIEVFRNLSRVFIALVVSLSIKLIFGSIRTMSGFCSNEDIHRRQVCLQEGHRWISFEASEEAFILIYHTLLIMEEVRNFKRWESLDFALLKDPWNVLLSPEQTARNVVFAKRTYAQYSGTVKLLVLLLTLLCVVWDVMLVMTAVFYQNLAQKICGSVFACLIWFITYQLWYPVAWPRLPAIGIFREPPSPGPGKR